MFKEFVMENNPTAFCHASTIIKLRTGEYMCCWFGGTHEGNPDVAIFSSRKTDLGWTAPQKLADGVEANWNPVLFYREDGTTIIAGNNALQMSVAEAAEKKEGQKTEN